jgi:hypothetical protein
MPFRSPAAIAPRSHLHLVGFSLVTQRPGSNQGYVSQHCKLVATQRRFSRLLEQMVETGSEFGVGRLVDALFRFKPRQSKQSK